MRLLNLFVRVTLINISMCWASKACETDVMISLLSEIQVSSTQLQLIQLSHLTCHPLAVGWGPGVSARGGKGGGSEGMVGIG